MRITALLKKAATCKTDEDAGRLRAELTDLFCRTRQLGHLSWQNPEAYMEGEAPHVHFELTRALSNVYVYTVSPEIRHGKLTVRCYLIRTNDDLGQATSDYAIVDEHDDLIDAYETDTIVSLARRVRDLAIATHRILIEEVGVPRKAAQRAALASW